MLECFLNKGDYKQSKIKAIITWKMERGDWIQAFWGYSGYIGLIGKARIC